MKGNRKKILLCSPMGGNIGGIARWTEHIKNYYDDQNDKSWFTIKVYSTSRKKSIHENKSYFRRIYSGLLDYIPIIIKFQKVIKLDKYNIVHITSSGSISLIKDVILLKFAKTRNIKTVLHFHFGRIPEVYLKRNWEFKLLNLVIRISDKAIVIDSKSYEVLYNQGYSNIDYLPNPISPKIQNIIDDNYNEIIKSERTLLYAGHVVETKGIFELIESAKQIPNIKLKLVGRITDDMKHKIIKLAGNRHTEWLEISGEKSFEETILEMLAAGIFVLPSYTEGFPNVILESMACACPIVATNVGAIPEMLDINNGNNYGLCVEPRNSRQLKNAIEKMLNDRNFAHTCGRNAQKRVNDLYSMPAIWEKLESIWTTL